MDDNSVTYSSDPKVGVDGNGDTIMTWLEANATTGDLELQIKWFNSTASPALDWENYGTVDPFPASFGDPAGVFLLVRIRPSSPV